MINKQWLYFTVGNERYIHPVKEIERILTDSEIQHKARIEPALDLDINEVIDGEEVLPSTHSHSSKTDKVLIFKDNKKAYGVKVDKVLDILFIQKENIKQTQNQKYESVIGTINICGKDYTAVNFSDMDSCL